MSEKKEIECAYNLKDAMNKKFIHWKKNEKQLKNGWVYLYKCADCGETSDKKDLVEISFVFSCPVCGSFKISYERFER